MNDVSNATWQIMQKGQNGETYHISTEEVISIRDLVEHICFKLNVKFENHVEYIGERAGKDAAYHLDSSKLRTELGWKDSINLDKGLDECIVWVKNNLTHLKNLPFDYIHKS
jgi:dTDP-glucose 4,6-dehydratase